MGRFLFGIIGNPLTHSFSPNYFNNKFTSLGLDASYTRFELDNISLFPGLIRQYENLIGLNVTLPFKQSIVPYLDVLNGAAEELKTVNTIIKRQGRLSGYNTDVLGFEHLLIRNKISSLQSALVLGSGGSSSAIQYVLRKIGMSYVVVSRGESSDSRFIRYHDLYKELIQSHLVIIHCTPLGMYPNINESVAFPYEYLTPQHTCIDLIYNPEKTLFLKQAERKGSTLINGYDMLVAQAEASWELWRSLIH
jgi:shikimate dehydrogenase